MIENKLDRIFQFLKEQNITISTLIPDNFKCIMCYNVPAYGTSPMCGCRFCPQCMEKLLKSGIPYCPGTSTECKKEMLTSDSNTHVNYCVNNELSGISIKCPKTRCSFECSLENIEEHMRACGKERIKCPFARMGCRKPWITRDRMCNHLSWHCAMHNDLLMNSIGTIGRDTSSWEECTGNILIEINKIRKNLIKIDTLNQMHREEFQDQMSNLKMEFDGNLGKVAKEVNTLKQIHLSTVNPQFMVEFQDQLINGKVMSGEDSRSSSDDINALTQSDETSSDKSATDKELTIVRKDNAGKEQELKEIIFGKDGIKRLKSNESVKLVKRTPNMWTLFQKSFSVRTNRKNSPRSKLPGTV